MLLIVIVTGAFGFLFSFFLLHAGVIAMTLRYPLAVGFAYLVFLALLRLWLKYQVTADSSGTSHGGYDVLDATQCLPDVVTGYDGGSASGPGSTGDALGAFDLDELVFVVIAVAAIFAGFLVCLYVVWTGPALLAEVLVDGLVMSRIYKRLKVTGPAYWLPGVLRRTWLPVVLVALFLAVAGFAMQTIAPSAKSIGPVIGHVLGNDR
jgi:hypothetical protein